MQTQSVLNVVLEFERDNRLVDKGQLHRAISNTIESGSPLTFLVFSCLATEKEREYLIEDYFRTLFFCGSYNHGGPKTLGHRPRKVLHLIQEIERLGLVAQVIPILVDTEPRRTWGWKTNQEDLSFQCELMFEQADDSGLFPDNWHPSMWSMLEKRYTGQETFEKCLQWVRTSGPQAIRIREQVKCLRNFADRYHFPLGIEETAVRQVAAYAFEGIVLEQVFPNAILLQSEEPWKEKDCLYQLRRDKKNTLCIVHPFD